MKSASKYTPISAGAVRNQATGRIKDLVERHEVQTAAQALSSIKRESHRNYVKHRVSGKSKPESWIAAGGGRKSALAVSQRLERKPAIQAAIQHIEQAALRGSLMSIAQRKDYTLDKLVEETLGDAPAVRVRALELLGKSVGLFIERQEVVVTDAGDVRERIATLLAGIRQREVIEGEVITDLNAAAMTDAGLDAPSASGEQP